MLYSGNVLFTKSSSAPKIVHNHVVGLRIVLTGSPSTQRHNKIVISLEPLQIFKQNLG